MARVEISTPTRKDEAEFIAAMTASADLHRPWLYPPVTSQAYREYLARLIPDRKHGFLARRAEDRALVGWLNVSDIVRGALQGANVSYGGVAARGRRQSFRRAGFQLEGWSPGYLEIDGDRRDRERLALRSEAWIVRRR